MQEKTIQKLALTGMFLALGLVLPFLTGQIQQIGNMLLPMHLPVFLCALVCGWKYGVPMAFVLPLMRSFLFGMPPLFPTAVAMAFELATYAFIAGFLYGRVRRQGVRAVYACLLIAMIAGRLVWGVVQVILLGLSGSAFTLQMFWAGAFLNAIPGIILQLVLIPVIMVLLDRTHLVPFRREEAAA